jgi:hypothetical protein
MGPEGKYFRAAAGWRLANLLSRVLRRITLMFLPSYSVPFNRFIASSASAGADIRMKLNPFDRLLILSLMTQADTTSPYRSNRPTKSCSVTRRDRSPTHMFIILSLVYATSADGIGIMGYASSDQFKNKRKIENLKYVRSGRLLHRLIRTYSLCPKYNFSFIEIWCFFLTMKT